MNKIYNTTTGATKGTQKSSINLKRISSVVGSVPENNVSETATNDIDSAIEKADDTLDLLVKTGLKSHLLVLGFELNAIINKRISAIFNEIDKL